jgi:hypothetical protein
LRVDVGLDEQAGVVGGQTVRAGGRARHRRGVPVVVQAEDDVGLFRQRLRERAVAHDLRVRAEPVLHRVRLLDDRRVAGEEQPAAAGAVRLGLELDLAE